MKYSFLIKRARERKKEYLFYLVSVSEVIRRTQLFGEILSIKNVSPPPVVLFKRERWFLSQKRTLASIINVQ